MIEKKIDYKKLVKKLKIEDKITFLPLKEINPLSWNDALYLLGLISEEIQSSAENVIIENLLHEVHELN